MKAGAKYLLMAVVAVMMVACRKDIPPQKPTATGSISTSKRLLICNEGNFGLPKASITVYDPVSGAVVPDAYGAANSNQALGDVLQSYGKFNSTYYWVVNNSGKIVVTDKNFTRLSTINGFISPRYIEFVSNNKAYVSNYISPSAAVQTNYIQVIDLNTNSISKSIRVDGWTEEMAYSYGKVFVCDQKKKYVYVIDAITDLVSDSIFVNSTSACIVKDQNEKLWVSCNADAGNGVPARLVRIDPGSHQVEADISLATTQASISRLVINGDGNTLYYLMNDVYGFSISATSPSSPLISQGSRVFYGLSVDPYDETIYVGDAIDYNQNGTILTYKSDGTYLANFKSGIIPGYMRIDD